MQPLEILIRDARTLAGGEPGPGRPSTAAEAEADRILQICNACRYCEGYCAVFPAMARRLSFAQADLHYLANLCHNCGACLHACQYAAPHEFDVNVPRTMARVRVQTYAAYAWPRALGRLYDSNGLTLSLAIAGSLSVVLALATWPGSEAARGKAQSFYAVIPHQTMVTLFGAVFAFALLALSLGVLRFWRDVSPGAASGGAVAEAGADILRLKYLDGGHGMGCNEADDAFTLARRRFHHLVFYGFALCFASTSVATIYHYALGWPAPYAWTSLPKLLGTAGGIGLLVGCAGLWQLNRRRDPLHGDAAQRPMDLGFIALLLLTSASGLAVAIGRDLPVMPWLLCLHLGSVLALFATLPYGKFAHGIYRGAALLKWNIEHRTPAGPGTEAG